MAQIRIETVFNIDLLFESAPVHKRVSAYGIDLFVMIAYLIVMKFIMYDVFALSTYDFIGLDMLLISIPLLLYPLLCELFMHGQSIGKRMMKIRVISMTGSEPTVSQYIIRWSTRVFEWPFVFGYIAYSQMSIIYYFYITAILGIVVIVIVSISELNQRLGDLAAGTAVVNTLSTMNVSDTIFLNLNNTNYEVMFPQVMRLSDRDINIIQNVIKQSKSYGHNVADRIAAKVMDVLQIQTSLDTVSFLEKLLEDYNYLATKE